jgi:hypothetical protein
VRISATRARWPPDSVAAGARRIRAGRLAQCGLDARAPLVAVAHALVQREREVAADGQVREQRSSWNRMPMRRRCGRRRGDVVVADAHAAARVERRIDEPRDERQQRRLAAPRRPHERHAAARVDRQVEAVDQRAVAERDADAVEDERVHRLDRRPGISTAAR